MFFTLNDLFWDDENEYPIYVHYHPHRLKHCAQRVKRSLSNIRSFNMASLLSAVENSSAGKFLPAIFRSTFMFFFLQYLEKTPDYVLSRRNMAITFRQHGI